VAIRIMFDSVDPFNTIPADAAMVATYANGKYAVPLRDVKAHWPDAKLIRINVTGDPFYGNCLDVETGDASAQDIPGWVQERRAKGVTDLAVYCDRSNLAAVQQAGRGLGLFHWVATLDGTLAIPGYTPLTGPAAVQAINASMAGVNADISLVFEGNWHA
jgi:hypothetical protein